MDIIRPATAVDIPSITAITNALLSTTTYEWRETPYSSDERREWLRDQEKAGRPVLVADDGGEVVGWTSYGDFTRFDTPTGLPVHGQSSIHVATSHWGRGVGRLLMTGLIDRARSDGRRVMVAAVDSSNGRAIEFHARLGLGRWPGCRGSVTSGANASTLSSSRRRSLTILADDDEADGRPTEKGLIVVESNAKSWNLNAWN